MNKPIICCIYQKKIAIDNQLLQEITINQKHLFRERYELLSEADEDVAFLWQITQNTKNTLGINLHVYDKDSNIGLLRVDYNGGHVNPVIVNEYVPEKLSKYAGKWLKSSHIHYYVQGYKILSWAIPLEDDDFPVKSIDTNNFYETFADIIQAFAKRINVETIIHINKLLL